MCFKVRPCTFAELRVAAYFVCVGHAMRVNMIHLAAEVCTVALPSDLKGRLGASNEISSDHDCAGQPMVKRGSGALYDRLRCIFYTPPPSFGS